MDVINGQDTANRLMAQFDKKDKRINELFDMLHNYAEDYSDNIQHNLQLTLSMEFILMKLRVAIVSETSVVKSVLNGVNLNPTIKVAFSKRLDYLNTVDTRLNELRDDYNSIQKMAYTLKQNNLSSI